MADMMADENDATDGNGEHDLGTQDVLGQSLDPFSFHGHPASSIVGLGGDVPLPDASYAFHTPYVPVARGHAHFLVRFNNLQARRGSLILRVHMLPDEPDAVGVMVTSHRVQLNWLAHHGGQIQLRFEAFRGARYAIMGVTPDQLDASADGLEITLDRPATPEDIAAGGAIEGQTTAFASDTIRPVSMALLLSMEPPSFAQPVSQPYTPSQARERAFRDRSATLAGLPADPAARWQAAYVLQVLDRYGVLRSGARGLMLGRANPPVEAAVTTAGAVIQRVALNHGGEDRSVLVLDPADLPGELFAFDFLVSIRATDELSDGRAATRFLERSIESLRPGGLAVHLVAHHPDPAHVGQLTFDRNGLERLAFALISSGHQLARLKPISASLHSPVIPFGLIARRGSTIR